MVDYLINKKRGMQMRRIVSKIVVLGLLMFLIAGCKNEKEEQHKRIVNEINKAVKEEKVVEKIPIEELKELLRLNSGAKGIFSKENPVKDFYNVVKFIEKNNSLTVSWKKNSSFTKSDDGLYYPRDNAVAEDNFSNMMRGVNMILSCIMHTGYLSKNPDLKQLHLEIFVTKEIKNEWGDIIDNKKTILFKATYSRGNIEKLFEKWMENKEVDLMAIASKFWYSQKLLTDD